MPPSVMLPGWEEPVKRGHRTPPRDPTALTSFWHRDVGSAFRRVERTGCSGCRQHYLPSGEGDVWARGRKDFGSDLGSYQVAGDTLVVELSDLAGPPGSLVIADAVRVERVGDLVVGPEIRVSASGVDVADGAGPVDFASSSMRSNRQCPRASSNSTRMMPTRTHTTSSSSCPSQGSTRSWRPECSGFSSWAASALERGGCRSRSGLATGFEPAPRSVF